MLIRGCWMHPWVKCITNITFITLTHHPQGWVLRVLVSLSMGYSHRAYHSSQLSCWLILPSIPWASSPHVGWTPMRLCAQMILCSPFEGIEWDMAPPRLLITLVGFNRFSPWLRPQLSVIGTVFILWHVTWLTFPCTVNTVYRLRRVTWLKFPWVFSMHLGQTIRYPWLNQASVGVVER